MTPRGLSATAIRRISQPSAPTRNAGSVHRIVFRGRRRLAGLGILALAAVDTAAERAEPRDRAAERHLQRADQRAGTTVEATPELYRAGADRYLGGDGQGVTACTAPEADDKRVGRVGDHQDSDPPLLLIVTLISNSPPVATMLAAPVTVGVSLSNSPAPVIVQRPIPTPSLSVKVALPRRAALCRRRSPYSVATVRVRSVPPVAGWSQRRSRSPSRRWCRPL